MKFRSKDARANNPSLPNTKDESLEILNPKEEELSDTNSIDTVLKDIPIDDSPIEIDANSLELLGEDTLKSKNYEDLLNDADSIQVPEIFNKPLELSLRLHEDCLLNLRHNFLENPDLQLQSEIQGSRSLLDFKLSSLNKSYRTHVSTIARNYLMREVIKSKEVQSQKGQITKNRISFLVLVRTYEKLSSFNDKAQEIWDEIFMLLKALKKIPSSRNLVLEFEKLYMEKIRSLLNNTAFFLNYLYDYLSVSSKRKDKSGNTKISASFSKECPYQISDMLAQIPSDLLQKTETLISMERKRALSLDVNFNRDPQSDLHIFSIQKTFFQGGKSIHKQYSRISTEMKGSRDWNRRELYHFEISIKELEFCMNYFDNCYLLELDKDSRDISYHYKMNALKNRGLAAKRLKEYEKTEIQILNELVSTIMEKDFPQIKEAEIFLYHCTPHLLYKLLIEEFRQRRFGLAYYVDRNGERWHGYPESFIKKIFISWWEEYFAGLDTLKLDSYLLYSQQIRTLQNICEELYQKAREQQRVERGYLSLQEQEEWLWKNRELIFGNRKNEIFLRFSVKLNNARAFRQANQYIFQRLGI